MFREPVRKIGFGSRSITGKRPSAKTGGSHQFESSLERDYLTLLEFDEEVERYLVQPVTIEYLHQDKLRHYTPDMAVYYKLRASSKPLLVEIKYHAELLAKKELFEPKFAAASNYALHNGYEFKVLTEKEIRTDYLQNVKFLSNYRNKKIYPRDAEALISKLNNTSYTIGQLVSGKNEKLKGQMLNTLWQLLANHTLACDMYTKISMKSIVWRRE
jgi:hypothetical protein